MNPRPERVSKQIIRVPFLYAFPPFIAFAAECLTAQSSQNGALPQLSAASALLSPLFVNVPDSTPGTMKKMIIRLIFRAAYAIISIALFLTRLALSQ